MSRHPDQFADELRLIAGGLEGAAGALRECGDSVEAGADEFDRVVEERDELRAENARLSAMSDEWRQAFDKERAKVARMRPVVEAAEFFHSERWSRHVPAAEPAARIDRAVRAFREGRGS